MPAAALLSVAVALLAWALPLWVRRRRGCAPAVGRGRWARAGLRGSDGIGFRFCDGTRLLLSVDSGRAAKASTQGKITSFHNGVLLPGQHPLPAGDVASLMPPLSPLENKVKPVPLLWG